MGLREFGCLLFFSYALGWNWAFSMCIPRTPFPSFSKQFLWYVFLILFASIGLKLELFHNPSSGLVRAITLSTCSTRRLVDFSSRSFGFSWSRRSSHSVLLCRSDSRRFFGPIKDITCFWFFYEIWFYFNTSYYGFVHWSILKYYFWAYL